MSSDGVMARPDSALLSDLSPAKRALLEQRLAQRGARAQAAIPRRPEGARIPLTPAQRMLWVHDRVASGRAGYNMPEVLRLRGALDEDALRRALDAVVARHEALRTMIGGTETEPCQVVCPAAPVSVARYDLQAEVEPMRRAEEDRIVRALATTPFDLTAQPPLRVALIRAGDLEHVLIIVTHHIVSDGWSRGVFFRDLGRAYAAARTGDVAALPALACQFGDYAVWLEGEHARETGERDIAFWKQQFANGAPVLDLPTDRPRPSRPSGDGGVIRRVFPPDVRDAIAAYARARGATPFSVLLAAWNITLASYSGQREIVVGTPMAGRGRPELEGLIGYFVNTVPLRTSLEENPTFASLVARVHEHALAAADHQDVPVEAIARDAKIDGASLFRVLIALQNHTHWRLSLDGLEVVPQTPIAPAVIADLSVLMRERQDGLLLHVEYAAELFDVESIEAMLSHVAHVLACCLAHDDVPVWTLPLIGDGERRTLLDRFGRGPRYDVPSISLDEYVAAQASATPCNVAVRAASGALTYEALIQRADHLASRLRAQGVGRGDFVAIVMDRSLDLVVSMLATLKAGAAYVPIDPAYPSDRIAYMLRDCGARLAVTHARFSGIAAPTPTLCLDVDDEAAEEAATHSSMADQRNARDPAYLVYTSGSTGAPKGVPIPHSAIVNYVHWLRHAYPIGVGDVVVQQTPISFDASAWEFWVPLTTGAEVFLASPGAERDPALLINDIRGRGVTIATAVPSVLRLMLDTGTLNACHSLRLLVSGGEALTPDLARGISHELPHVQIVNMYGPAEVTIDATSWMLPPGAVPDTIAIGHPIGNASVYVLSPEGQLVPVGGSGELYVGGAGVALGYHGRPALTAERFVTDPFATEAGARMYRTGDRARWDRDGRLHYLGRADDQVKVRGVRVELGEIEAAMRAVPGVLNAVARTVVRPGVGTMIIGYVVVRDADNPAPAHIRASLARSLPQAVLPAVIVPVDAIPLSPSGKIDRSALPMPNLDGDPGGRVPTTVVERAVARIWRLMLRVERVPADASFFEFGGHSLLAVQLVGKIAQAFGRTVPLRVFFDDPTVAGVARALCADAAERPRIEHVAAALCRLESMPHDERMRVRQSAAEPTHMGNL